MKTVLTTIVQVSAGPGLAALHATAICRLPLCSVLASSLYEGWPGVATASQGMSVWNTEKGAIFDFRSDYRKKTNRRRTEIILHIVLKLSSRSCLFPEMRTERKFWCKSGIIRTKEEERKNRAFMPSTVIQGSHYILGLKFKDLSRTFKDFQGLWSCIFKDQFSTDVYRMDSITAIFNICFCDCGTVLVHKNKTLQLFANLVLGKIHV